MRTYILILFVSLFSFHGCNKKPNENNIDIFELIFFDSKNNSEVSFLFNMQNEYLLISNPKPKIIIPRSKDAVKLVEENDFENELIQLTKNNIKSLTNQINLFTDEDFTNKRETSLDGGAFVINIIYKNNVYKNITRINNFSKNQTDLFFDLLKIISEKSENKNNKIFSTYQLSKFSNR
jgi:hypothetical protein